MSNGFGEMQTEGYMIVLMPEPLLQQYAQSYVAQQHAEPLRQLREAFAVFDPERYRGISRYPLSAFPSLEQDIIDDLQARGCDMKSDAAACRRFREILGEPPDDLDVDEDVLASLRDAQEVLSLTDTPENWEIIRVCRLSPTPEAHTLGFDIGYWGGDHFSLIADTIVTPCWHPPAPEDFEGMREALSRLNGSLLFNSGQEAEDYKAYYKSRPWAETENDQAQFRVIRVDPV